MLLVNTEARMGVRKTSVAIDEELLAEAREILETDTIRDTVHQALLEVIRARARHEEIAALRNMEGMELDDDDVMSKAWRG
jgi:Arc/MetJ family transcription regulator